MGSSGGEGHAPPVTPWGQLLWRMPNSRERRDGELGRPGVPACPRSHVSVLGQVVWCRYRVRALSAVRAGAPMEFVGVRAAAACREVARACACPGVFWGALTPSQSRWRLPPVLFPGSPAAIPEPPPPLRPLWPPSPALRCHPCLVGGAGGSRGTRGGPHGTRGGAQGARGGPQGTRGWFTGC